MSVSLKQMRYFVAAAEAGRIGQAAVELNVSQSAVTAAIQQLEGALGFRLLDRTALGVSVTLEGGRFLQQARDILMAVAEATRHSRVAPREVAGPLRVGVTYTVAGYFLPRHLVRFSASFPAVELELFEAPRTVVEQALRDGALDIAVLLVSNVDPGGPIGFETLTRSRRRLWMAPGHALSKLDRVGLADVARHPYVMLTVDEARATALRYWTSAGIEPDVVFRTSSVEAVRSMVAGGMGVTVLSDMVYRPWSLEGQRIETRLLEEEIPTMDVGLAWMRGAALTPAAEAFRDFLRFALTGVGNHRAEERAAASSILSMAPAS
ncbi:LysR family transcriptional regulator [Aurantimonas sp. Leaf443]|uniref:LysR family transcriptional regulator n=1 Tax=Aurantimonas sp. Leaf443 TaxID=1736378 RepID=UPI0006FEAE1A|nr:LysR family transcriptional regulator [Aurantimonas sp. Leaf443]KQT82817.1 LysR family transcriptional regulator [Aurantimonas sp. Leaf443]